MTDPGFRVMWSPSAIRQLRRLPEKAAAAVVELVYGSLTAKPHRVGKQLRPPLAGLHSAQRGGYRVIYQIDDDARRVDVVALGHRSDIYR